MEPLMAYFHLFLLGALAISYQILSFLKFSKFLVKFVFVIYFTFSIYFITNIIKKNTYISSLFYGFVLTGFYFFNYFSDFNLLSPLVSL